MTVYRKGKLTKTRGLQQRSLRRGQLFVVFDQQNRRDRSRANRRDSRDFDSRAAAGNRIVTVVPLPISLSTCTLPPAKNKGEPEHA
jgi:hypothetical protein